MDRSRCNLVAAVAVVLSGVFSLTAQADTLPPSSVISKQRMLKTREHAHGGGLGRRSRPTKEFIYVYDMPAKFTSDVKELSLDWHPEQYDYDQVCIQTASTMAIFNQGYRDNMR